MLVVNSVNKFVVFTDYLHIAAVGNIFCSTISSVVSNMSIFNLYFIDIMLLSLRVVIILADEGNDIFLEPSFGADASREYGNHAPGC